MGISTQPPDQISSSILGQTEGKITNYFGNQALNNRDKGTLVFPIKRGIIEDFENLEKMWTNILEKELNLNKILDFVITENPIQSKQSRGRIAQRFFDQNIQANSLAMINQAVLSIFSTGKSSGLVVEIGEGATYIAPIFEGFCLQHATLMLPNSGQDITDQLTKNLKKKGINIDPNLFEFSRDIKEQMCSVALNYEEALKSPDPLKEELSYYELPDSQVIKVDHQARFNATEILFQPKLREANCMGLVEAIVDSIDRCSLDIKKTMISNIVLSGGSTLLKGLKERLEADLSKSLKPELSEVIDICEHSHRKYSSWIGASMFASMSTFNEFCITKNEYEDSGDKALDKEIIAWSKGI